MNKIFAFLHNHKDQVEDAAGIAVIAVLALAFFFGRGIAVVVCSVAGLFALGANVTA